MEDQDKNKIKIAGLLTIKAWKDLEDIVNSSTNKNWENAFNFFEQRITTRYLNPIHKILNMNLSTGEGFAVVNLQCSLIETIECFYNGWIYEKSDYKKNGAVVKYPIGSNDKMKNKHVFENFFKEREPFKKVNIDGKSFYQDVRCALLHETQTKNGWVIRDKHYDRFYEEIEGEKIIYRTNFQTSIETVIGKYKKDIVEGEAASKDLHENFKAKLNHICKVS